MLSSLRLTHVGLKDNSYPQRLNPLAHRNMGCDSLFSREIMRGRFEEVSPPYIFYMVNKSNSIITNSQNEDPVLNEAAARLGVSLRQTEDQLTRDMLASTASYVNCVGGINGDNPTNITLSDCQSVVRALLNNNTYTIMDNIEGEDKFGTGPVRDAYFALCSTQLTGNLDNVATFIHKNQYPAPMNALRSEWGAIGNLRFLISSIGSVFPNASANGANVYNIFCTGLESYCCIEQDGYSASFIYRPPIYSDPLAQNISVGYKIAEVPRILNDLWIINLRCTLLRP